MATDIDFKEIEKAMAELVNNNQTDSRKKQLTKVLKKRDEIAKKVDNHREQGIVATKRIIIGNKNLRSSVVGTNNSEPSKSLRPNPVSVISDFKTSKSFAAPTTSPKPISQISPKPEQAPLNQSVGELSDQFLKEEVSQNNQDAKLNSFEPEEDLAEPEFAEPELTSAPPVPEQIQPEPEAQIPPAPVPTPEPEPEPIDPLEGLLPAEDQPQIQPEPAAPAYNPNSGAVHRMYGQRMKAPAVAASPIQDQVQNQNLPVPQKHKKKKGFLFYFVMLLTLAALGVWGYVGYIFFVPKS